MPRTGAAKIKTDRRDAIQLARSHRAGDLTAIHLPDPRDEAIRDLCRGRTDAVQDRTRVRHRLKAFLLRNGHVYPGQANWSEAHKRYLRGLTFALHGQRELLEEYLLAVDEAEARVHRYDDMLEIALETWRLRVVVEALMCLRGFQRVAAMAVVAELGDTRRFEHPRKLMSFLGLTPSEQSSGQTRRLGGITRAGNPHARWMLCEAAIHYRLSPKISRPLSKRQEGQPGFAKEIGWKAQQRLHQRHCRLTHRGVHQGKVKAAIARELTGFVWDLTQRAWALVPRDRDQNEVVPQAQTA